ncbi:sulfite oxidase [Flavilitoribacter nigricans]|uniref:Molybdopterin containing oxidoreductase n=1 Tax=Flavilitoribacter nigricans (strain ATCC 23147 / DSM 23189 / NBRC 102662 / NCIMB 1420 / SS-2) TaxID=1122177 RepID=A0A2D0NFG6_FLAN2|nr:sulfite oxidase [Flavilitoribacter nigricans]PHN07130.1 molybdopterin containing oxidoreductase [Flavilitoribacter nigricans DSM 23189 = NBRC 102662]
MAKKYIGLHELYAKDPELADRLLWGRQSHSNSRRGFLQRSALLAMGAVLGGNMVYGRNFPAGMIPAGLANSSEAFALPGKHPDLVVLNDRPVNAETPAHLLDDKVTPADLLFVRNNGLPPQVEGIDPNTWTLTIEGESARTSKSYTLADLKSRFREYTYHLTLECGGNGRSEFNPPAKGNQWTVGAVGCAAWTGVRLRDVLEDVGVGSDAVYIGYYGKDSHLSGDPEKDPISRGVPISKAMQNESLIAWAINGEAIPVLNGYPLRLVFGGWPASTSGKWLSRIVIRNKVHDGEKMTGQSYRVPCKPVAPGVSVADEDMCIIENMPVKSLITFPQSGATIRKGQALPLRGHAWAGELSIQKVEYSIDFGSTWRTCKLEGPVNKMAWQHWSATVSDFPETGYYEVWARATDSNGIAQPMVLPGWNPRGYLNNACHRIAVKVVK